MNGLLILQTITTLTDLGLLLLILWKYLSQTSARDWVYAHIAITIWAFGDLLVSLSPNINTALFFYRLTDAAACWVGYLLLRFIINLLKPEISKAKSINYTYFVPIVFLSAAALLSNWFTPSMLPSKWGYDPIHNPSFYVLTIFVLCTAIAALVLPIFRWSRLNQSQKKQARLFIVAYLIPLVFGSISEFLGPLFGWDLPPLTNVCFAFTALLMTYAISQKQFFTFRPELILDRIFESMSELVIVLDTEEKIVFCNRKVVQVSGYQEDELVGHRITDVISFPTQLELKSTSSENAWLVTKTTQSKRELTLSIDEITVAGEKHGLLIVGRDVGEIDRLVLDLRAKTDELLATNNKLQESLDEKSKMNEYMVGRELKMAEMKEEIERLNAKVKVEV